MDEPQPSTTSAHQTVKDRLLTALELDEGVRASWFAALERMDAVVAREVRRLLDAHLRAGAFLDLPDGDPDAVEAPISPHTAIGPFEVERELGRGGMGRVYLGTRRDQGFVQQVAIKVLGTDVPAGAAERLRDERRILAALNHPCIAHFVDGGTTADGLPYLAMEYVDGQPITRHATDAGLDVPARLRMFLLVCAAVHFAHQRLVVHRDIKPSNILVTADGTPKLLDFGIAKLLDTVEPGPAAGTLRVLTPHYASPEQVLGDPVTTATDVYSLGVLLFELLTGRGPYRRVTPDSSPLAVMEAIRDAAPERPGAFAPSSRTIGRDLDAIVLKALRKDPRERYGSAEQFAQDIARYLDGLPVAARRGTTLYRAQRFAGRHWIGVTAAATLAVAVVGGGAATAWQARVAQFERDKAQNRFRQIEEFSRSLLFDVHGALRDVPGATEARRLLLGRATTFLDGLVADAGGDPELMRTLAAGYQQLANVQGSGFTQNVGDAAGALASLDKAAGYIDALRLDDPDDVDLLMRAIDIHFGRAAVMGTLEHPRMTDERVVHAALVAELERRHAYTPRVIEEVARGYSDIGRLQANSGDYAAAEQAYRRSVELYATLPAAGWTAQLTTGHAFALKRLGAVLMRRQAFAESEQRYLEALGLDEETIRLSDRPQSRFDITFTLSDLALVRSAMNRWADAEVLWRRALAIREAAWAADPKDTRALAGVGVLYGRLGLAARSRHDLSASAEAYRTEVDRRQQLVALSGRLPGRVADLSWARLRLAEALLDLADLAPGTANRAARIAETRRLVAATTRADGKPPVAAGSEPGYQELYDVLTRRLAGEVLTGKRR